MLEFESCAHTHETIMDQKTKRLRDLMAAHKLDCAAVGEMLGRTAQTVRVWRCAYEDRTIPADALKVLELTLASRGVAA